MTNRELIVVGVDGSEGGRRAYRWALAEARRTGSAVEAVTAWSWDGVESGPRSQASPFLQRQRAEAVSAAEFEAVVSETGSSTPIAREVVEGHPVGVLVEAARYARLLVLGSHGYSRLHHAVLGSISEECIRQATCPVVVVPVPRPQPVTVSEPVPVS